MYRKKAREWNFLLSIDIIAIVKLNCHFWSWKKINLKVNLACEKKSPMNYTRISILLTASFWTHIDGERKKKWGYFWCLFNLILITIFGLNALIKINLCSTPQGHWHWRKKKGEGESDAEEKFINVFIILHFFRAFTFT